jgi:hypothetical protein
LRFVDEHAAIPPATAEIEGACTYRLIILKRQPEHSTKANNNRTVSQNLGKRSKERVVWANGY